VGMIKAVREVVHHGGSVEDAYRLFVAGEAPTTKQRKTASPG